MFLASDKTIDRSKNFISPNKCSTTVFIYYRKYKNYECAERRDFVSSCIDSLEIDVTTETLAQTLTSFIQWYYRIDISDNVVMFGW